MRLSGDDKYKNEAWFKELEKLETGLKTRNEELVVKSLMDLAGLQPLEKIIYYDDTDVMWFYIRLKNNYTTLLAVPLTLTKAIAAFGFFAKDIGIAAYSDDEFEELTEEDYEEYEESGKNE